MSKDIFKENECQKNKDKMRWNAKSLEWNMEKMKQGRSLKGAKYKENWKSVKLY